jgi:hypothetical protein
VIPEGRTQDYAIWRACERFGVLPPGLRKHYDDLPPWFQAMLIAYDQIRQIEEAKELGLMATGRIM